MLTLDANVWIASFDPQDSFYAQSLDFLSSVAQRQLSLFGPIFVVAETGCAVARRLRDRDAGRKTMQRLRRNPMLTLYPLHQRLLSVAEEAGVNYFIRATNALYVATAELSSTPLISWDQELVRRAGAVTPSAWLAANTE